MQQSETQPRRSVRARLGAEFLGFSETTFWLKAKNDPSFPLPYRIGKKTTLWFVDELMVWRERHKATRPAGEQQHSDVGEQLRTFLGDRGSVAELMPGAGTYLVTLTRDDQDKATSAR